MVKTKIAKVKHTNDVNIDTLAKTVIRVKILVRKGAETVVNSVKRYYVNCTNLESCPLSVLLWLIR